ncbi:MAG: serine/threonine-protein kinase [Dokdonella sp.]
MIEPARNQRDLFETALALPAEQRAAWLDQHCRDPDQRHALDRMLSADTEEDVLDRSFDDLLGRVGECEPDAAMRSPGASIGPFNLLAKIGEGGSSIVYRAEREQSGVKQTVALKLLRRGLYSEEEKNRFRRERRALAQLRHPGIAHLIEGGVTEAGVPYIALEFVEGAPITDYVREHHSDLRQRLRLFVAICRAVEAAHRALIVHRDLKPSNVLVTGEGDVKLLDFGIAKLLNGDGEDDSMHTQTLAMTPAYAAPEQFNRGLVTTATDVYALGILLGELVTGRRREHGDTRTPSSQVGSRVEPNAPPMAVRLLRRQLRGDLDNIVVKAIDGEPERRYTSAGALADDVERHLGGQPVAAHPPSRLYRARKFIARHRGGVATTLVLLLAIFAALGIALWQTGIARSEAARAATIKDFLIDMFRASDPRVAQDKPRGQITARELLDLNAARITQEFDGDAETQIELLGVAASIYRELDDDARYRALHAQQIDLARRRYGDAHPAIIDGLIDDAQHASNGNDYAGARKALAQADPLIGRAGLDRSVQRARWWQVQSGLLAEDDAAREQSDTALEHAVDLFAQVAPGNPGYVHALDSFGFRVLSSDPARAEQLYLRAIAAAANSRPRDDAELQHLAYPGLAQSREDQGDYAGAEDAYEHSADIARRTFGENHSTAWVPAAQHAWSVHRRGERERAHALFDHLLKLIPPDWSADSYDEYAREFYAGCLAAEGRASEAIPLLEAAQRVYIEKPSVDYELRRNRLILGDAYDRVGRTNEARTMIKASLDERIAKEAPDARTVMDARERWGRFLIDQQDLIGAEAQLREVLAQTHGRKIVTAALAESDLARLAMLRNDLPTALDASARAVESFEHVLGRLDVRSGPAIWLIRSDVLRRHGDLRGARDWAQRALDASRRYDDASATSIVAATAAVNATQ